MKKNIYSVYDKVACIFFNPFVAINDADACRMFDRAVADGQGTSDHELYLLGSMDDNSGEIASKGSSRIRTGLESLAVIKSSDASAQAALDLENAEEGK